MMPCDVLVVSAGIAACSAAYELAAGEANVVVAERGAVCSGSSALHAGVVRQQFSQEISVRAGMETIRLGGCQGVHKSNRRA
jgi:glycine/D-amino acid oxidase-like deaminating enzyme